MNKTLKRKDYWKIFLLYGIVFATIPIIITEVAWDSVIKVIGLNEGLLKDIIESFFRAALLEESFKFFGFMKANKKYNFSSEKEYMLGAGMIGLAYGIIEKLASGNILAIILGIIFPMHFLWQMNQGRHYYKYIKAKEENNNKKTKKELFLATFMIFLIHGCWDASLSLIDYFANIKTSSEIIGIILLIGTLLFGIIYLIVSIVKIVKVLKKEKKKE